VGASSGPFVLLCLLALLGSGWPPRATAGRTSKWGAHVLLFYFVLVRFMFVFDPVAAPSAVEPAWHTSLLLGSNPAQQAPIPRPPSPMQSSARANGCRRASRPASRAGPRVMRATTAADRAGFAWGGLCMPCGQQWLVHCGGGRVPALSMATLWLPWRSGRHHTGGISGDLNSLGSYEWDQAQAGSAAGSGK